MPHPPRPCAGGELRGFVHVELDGAVPCGVLVDNLNIAHALQRRAAGSRLLAAAADKVVVRRPGSGMYLRVLTRNVATQVFYRAPHGRLLDVAPVPPPGGDPARLIGTPFHVRVLWPDPTTLLNP